MFTPDETAGSWDLKIGEECYAGYTDGYCYLAVLLELGGTHAKVAFDPNRGIKNKEEPTQGTIHWTPLNELYNVSWALRKLKLEWFSPFFKTYDACIFAGVLPDGKIKVYEDGDKDLDKKTTYDCIRFSPPNEPFFPAAARVAASVTGRMPLDAASLRALLVKKLDRGLGIAASGDYQLFGKTIHVSRALAQRALLDGLYSKYLAVMQAFLEEHKYDSFRTVSDMQILYGKMGSRFGEIQSELFALLIRAGAMTTQSKLASQYGCTLTQTHLNELIDEYNELVKKKNEAIRGYNYSTRDQAMRDSYWAEAKMINPDSVMRWKKVLKLAEEDMLETLRSMIYSETFVPAVNGCLGEKYFDISANVDVEPTDTLWEGYRSMPAEDQDGPVGRDLLLEILERDPFDETACRELIIQHNEPGSGMEAFLEAVRPGRNLAREIKWNAMKEWFYTRDVSSKKNAATAVRLLRELYVERNLARDDIAPLYDYATLLGAACALDDAAGHDLLRRFDDAQFVNRGDHRELARMIGEAYEQLAGEMVDTAIPYRETLLALVEPLLALVDEDSRTWLGVRYPTYEEKEKITDETYDVTRAFWFMDFSRPDCVAEIDALVDAHKHKDLLQGYKQKARRAAELAKEEAAFVAETEGREYHTRQEEMYDYMRSLILLDEHKMLWMKQSAITERCKEIMHAVSDVFGVYYDVAFDMDKADARYFDTMEKAWQYQEYLDGKADTKAGFFKKIGTAISGIGKKSYEPEYMLATENGTKPLRSIAENERENCVSYWRYCLEERGRIYEEYCSRHDPAALDGHKRLEKIKAALKEFLRLGSLQAMGSAVIEGPWDMPNPADDLPDEFSLESITREYPPDYDFEAAAEAKAAARKRQDVHIRILSPVCKPKEQYTFEVTGVTLLMEADGAFAAIYEAGAAHKDYGPYCCVTQSQKQYTLKAPRKPGEYEIRVYSKYTVYTDETFVESMRFTIE